MKVDEEMRIAYTDEKNGKRVHVINLPKTFNEFKNICFDYFGIKKEEEKKKYISLLKMQEIQTFVFKTQII